jgi:hypothetical protein
MTHRTGLQGILELRPERFEGCFHHQCNARVRHGSVVASHDLDESGFAEQGPSSKLWTQLNGLRIYQVLYVPDGLPLYDPERVSELTQAALFEPPKSIDVTNLVKAYAATAETERLQVMAAFQRDTNPNMFAEYITWTSVRLAIVYAPD